MEHRTTLATNDIDVLDALLHYALHIIHINLALMSAMYR